MERKAHNYTLEYKNWSFKIDEAESWWYFYVHISYKGSCSMFISPHTKTVEETKERVENFIQTELK